MPKDADKLPGINFDITDESNFTEETYVVLSVEAQKEMWDRIKAKLRVQLGEDVYSSWFKGLTLENLDKNTIFLSVPTLFLRQWIETHYGEHILQLLQEEQEDIKAISVSVLNNLLPL